MKNSSALFVAGYRTPFTTAGKGLNKDTRPDDLLVKLLKSHQEKFPTLWQERPEDVLVGCAYPEGEQGYNVARVAASGAGLAAPGLTLNRLCASSLEAASIAASFIASGRGSYYLVAGVESMSRVPRRGHHFSMSEEISKSAPQTYVTMGETAEEVARRYPDITRSMQEDFAARSHEYAHQAWQSGFYAAQVMGEHKDDAVRFPVNRTKIATLPPAFSANGVVTAATSSPMSDGATCGLMMSEEKAKDLGISFGLRLVDAAVSAVDPEVMGLGPVPAVRKLLQRNHLGMGDIAAIEMNEAFAVQVLSCQKELEIPDHILNTHGGALALGHPLGASGLRLLATLAQRLEREESGRLGIATLCIGGGQGLAVLCQGVRPST